MLTHKGLSGEPLKIVLMPSEQGDKHD
jgi:hypothetical protein